MLISDTRPVELFELVTACRKACASCQKYKEDSSNCNGALGPIQSWYTCVSLPNPVIQSSSSADIEFTVAKALSISQARGIKYSAG